VANDEHLAILEQGVLAWNEWRRSNPGIQPELYRADLSGADLTRAHLARAHLTGADLTGAFLTGAFLGGADLTGAFLTGAFLGGAFLTDANLSDANLTDANLTGTNLYGANLRDADLTDANLTDANLSDANLTDANLTDANLTGANLRDADLTRAQLLGARLQEAILDGCIIYGISAWDLDLTGTIQRDLLITPIDEPAIRVDNLEVAQFVYLLLHNEKIRDVIETITTKVVLILGRFTDERKAVLYQVKEALRERGWVPIIFDFDPSHARNLTETIQLLASMARFVIADFTEPRSIPQEITAIVSHHVSVPIQPILMAGEHEWAMAKDYLDDSGTVLPIFEYRDVDHLLASLAADVIEPALAWRNPKHEVAQLRAANQAKEEEIAALKAQLALREETQ